MGQIITMSAGGIQIPLKESIIMEEENVRRERKNSILLPTSGRKKWKKLNIELAATKTPPPQKFIIANLPDEDGIYGLIIGPDGSRKSWLALHFAIAKALGKPVAGGLWPAPENPGRVVYITTEDSANVLWRRIFAIAAQPGNEDIKNLGDNLDILPISSITLISQTPEGPKFQEDLSGLIEYAKGAKLVILDPLAELADADESDDRAARMLVQAIKKLSHETGAGVIAIHHQNKNAMLNGGTSHQTGRGSSRLGAECRWAAVLQPLDQKAAEEHGVDKDDRSKWTLIHEAKANYASVDGVKSMYHYQDWMSNDGSTTPGIPLARDLNIKKGGATSRDGASTNGKYAHAKAKGGESDDLDQLMGL